MWRLSYIAADSLARRLFCRTRPQTTLSRPRRGITGGRPRGQLTILPDGSLAAVKTRRASAPPTPLPDVHLQLRDHPEICSPRPKQLSVPDLRHRRPPPAMPFGGSDLGFARRLAGFDRLRTARDGAPRRSPPDAEQSVGPVSSAGVAPAPSRLYTLCTMTTTKLSNPSTASPSHPSRRRCFGDPAARWLTAATVSAAGRCVMVPVLSHDNGRLAWPDPGVRGSASAHEPLERLPTWPVSAPLITHHRYGC